MPETDAGFGEFVAEPRAEFVTRARLAALQAAQALAEQNTQRTLLMTGTEAVAAAARNIDPSSRITVSSSVGPIELQSGTIYGRKQLLVVADTGRVIYLENDRLYKERTSVFVNNHYFSVLPEVAENSDWIIKVGKIEYAIISGLLAPIWALLGVFAVDVILTLKANPEPFELLWRFGPCVRDELWWLLRQHPEVFWPLVKAAAGEAQQDLVEGIEAEDVAFFLARIIFIVRNVQRNWVRAVLLFINTALFTLKVVLHAITLAAKRGTQAALTMAQREHAAAEFIEELRKQGLELAKSDALRIVEGLLRDPELRQRMEGLQTCLNGIVPGLEQLARRLVQL